MNLLELIKFWENSKLEFKESYSNNDSIAWEIVAFLNALGGILLFWISKEWDILGIDNLNILEEKIANISRNNIFPEVVLDFEIQKIDSKTIFVLKIPMGKNKPYEVKATRKKYIRVQTTKREVSREEEIRLWQSSGNLKYDNILLTDSNINEVEVKKVENFVKKMYNKNLNEVGIDYETLLQNLDICKKNIDNSIYPTFSGLYFFGKSDFIRKRIASSFLIFAYFKGKSIWWSEILDKKNIEGTFDEIYDDSVKIIHKYNAEYRQIKWYKADIRYDYPLEAIRETLMNAMLHRDYTYLGANIRVFMFEDRLEIISPGVLPNGLTVKALNSWIYQRFTRNEYIINFASKMFSNVAENLGSWVNRIKEICKKWWYNKPEYFLTENELRVIYYKKPVENKGKLGEKLGERLGENQRKIRDYIREKQNISIAELSNIMWISTTAIENNIKKLKEKEIIKRVGADRGGYWEVI